MFFPFFYFCLRERERKCKEGRKVRNRQKRHSTYERDHYYNIGVIVCIAHLSTNDSFSTHTNAPTPAYISIKSKISRYYYYDYSICFHRYAFRKWYILANIIVTPYIKYIPTYDSNVRSRIFLLFLFLQQQFFERYLYAHIVECFLVKIRTYMYLSVSLYGLHIARFFFLDRQCSKNHG